MVVVTITVTIQDVGSSNQYEGTATDLIDESLTLQSVTHLVHNALEAAKQDSHFE